MGIFSTGYEASKKEAERQEREKKNMGKKIFPYFLTMPKGEKSVEGDLHFLTELPMNFQQHTMQKFVNGENRWVSFTCSCDDNCPYCNEGDRPSYKGAYLVIDKKPYEDSKGTTHNQSIKLFTQGTRVVSQLERISEKYGLANREVTLVRNGTGTSTTYVVERGEEEPIDPNEVKELLPEALQDMYDGTEKSLYKIIEEQLLMMLPNPTSNVEEEEEVSDHSEDLIGVDDDEETSKPKLKTGKKTLFKSNK